MAALFAHLAWAALCLSFLIITDSAPAGGAVDSTLPDGWSGLALIWLDAPIEERGWLLATTRHALYNSVLWARGALGRLLVGRRGRETQ